MRVFTLAGSMNIHENALSDKAEFSGIRSVVSAINKLGLDIKLSDSKDAGAVPMPSPGANPFLEDAWTSALSRQNMRPDATLTTDKLTVAAKSAVHTIKNNLIAVAKDTGYEAEKVEIIAKNAIVGAAKYAEKEIVHKFKNHPVRFALEAGGTVAAVAAATAAAPLLAGGAALVGASEGVVAGAGLAGAGIEATTSTILGATAIKGGIKAARKITNGIEKSEPDINIAMNPTKNSLAKVEQANLNMQKNLASGALDATLAAAELIPGLRLAIGKMGLSFRYDVFRWINPQLETSSLGIRYALKSRLQHLLPGDNRADKVEVPSFTLGRFTGKSKAKVLRLDHDEPAARMWSRYRGSVVRIRNSNFTYSTGYAVALDPNAVNSSTTDLVATTKHSVMDDHGNPYNLQVDLANGKSVQARVAKVDPTKDTAIIRIDHAGLKPLPLGSARDMPYDASVRTLGYAEGSVTPFLTEGTAHATWFENPHLGINETGISMRIPAVDGNSGGPILDSEGQVVGTLTTMDTRFGYRIYGDGAEHVRRLLHDLDN